MAHDAFGDPLVPDPIVRVHKAAEFGILVAELETVLVLATIARRFRLELTARGMPAPVAQVTLRPGQKLPMRLRHR